MPNNILCDSNSKHFIPFLQPKITSSVLANVQCLIEKQWAFYIVQQSRGRAYLDRRQITLPIWSFQQTTKVGYATWYTAHECAHAFAFMQYGNDGLNHGPRFMEWLQKICPKQYLHYEVGYKPRNAMASGISKTQGNSIIKVGNKRYDIDMGDLL